MVIALSSYENSTIVICSDRSLSDLEYANDVVLLNEVNEVSCRFSSTVLTIISACVGMRFASSKNRMLLYDWTDSKPNG